MALPSFLLFEGILSDSNVICKSASRAGNRHQVRFPGGTLLHQVHLCSLLLVKSCEEATLQTTLGRLRMSHSMLSESDLMQMTAQCH